MKKVTMEKMEEHIKNVNKIPEEVKKEYRKKCFFNLILGIFFILYIVGIIIGKQYLKNDVFNICYKVLSINLLAIVIVLFENAYVKDSGELALYSIETFAISLLTLFSKELLKNGIPLYTKHLIIAITIYYIVKSVVIYLKAKNEVIRKNNDIQEIIKKESKDNLKPIMEEINKQNANVVKRKRGRPKKIINKGDEK